MAACPVADPFPQAKSPCRGPTLSFVTHLSPIPSSIQTAVSFRGSRHKRLESIGIGAAEILKKGLPAPQNYLHKTPAMTLRYPKYKNKSLHRRFFLDSAPQVWHSSPHTRRSCWERRFAEKTPRARNGIRVEHLAKPTMLTPPSTMYVVWFQQPGSDPENEGQLKVGDDLRGQLRTTTPLHSFDIFVTAETDPTTRTPSDQVLLQTRVQE